MSRWLSNLGGGRPEGSRTSAELPRPETTYDDPKAIEMVSIWLAHNGLQIAIRLGMWEADGQDEREAWGYLLADVVRHISHGMAQNSGWDARETAEQIRAALLKHSEDPGPPRGRFMDGG
jgi:hypothetical protein